MRYHYDTQNNDNSAKGQRTVTSDITGLFILHRNALAMPVRIWTTADGAMRLELHTTSGPVLWSADPDTSIRLLDHIERGGVIPNAFANDRIRSIVS